jgi:hypothetical protein
MRYIIGLFVTLGLLILLIVLIVHGGSHKAVVPNTTVSLESYATTDATVKLTIDGPIVASQNHNTAEITVGQNSTDLQLIQGYDGNVITSKTFTNSTNGYDAFLHALAHAGFTEGNTSSALKDESGICAQGDRYIFELQQDGKDLERYWATSCGGTKTYEGSVDLTTELFKAQIPGYDNLVETANL